MTERAPAPSQQQVSDQQRARYFHLTAITALAALLWGVGLAVYNGYPGFSWFFVFPLAVSVLSPIYVRRGGRALIAEHLLLISTLSCVLGLGLYTGGRATGTLFWSVFIPALAAVMTGWRAGALYGLVSFIVLSLIFFINLFQWSVPVPLPTAYAVNDVLINGPVAVAAITVLACGINIRLEATRRALTEHQQARILGRLTGSVAHDFNNVLGVIYGNLDLLGSTAGEEDRQELLNDIRAAARGGSQLVRTLQALSQVRPAIPQRVQPGHWLETTIDSVRRTVAKRRVRLTFQDHSNGAETSVDTALFESAIFHLCLNARDAMPEGGEIVVRVSEEPPDWIEITVTDSGFGMAREIAEQAVNPFFSTKSGNEGAGLGLPMVNAFVAEAGGTLEIETEPGEGTRVTLSLPRIDPAAKVDTGPEAVAAASADADATLPVSPAEHQTILLVEDEPSLRKVVCLMLKSLGYSVKLASDAAEAQQLLLLDRFDLVLTDWLMPGDMDGHQLAQWIRGKDPQARVLIATGYSDEVSKAARSADFPILFKPYSRAELERGVADALAAAP